jgi:hypothetical protein
MKWERRLRIVGFSLEDCIQTITRKLNEMGIKASVSDVEASFKAPTEGEEEAQEDDGLPLFFQKDWRDLAIEWEKGIDKLAALTNVPKKARTKFYWDCRDSVAKSADDGFCRLFFLHLRKSEEYRSDANILLEVERAAVATKQAMDKIPERLYRTIRIAMMPPGWWTGDPKSTAPLPDPISETQVSITKLIAAIAKMTGANPHRKKRSEDFSKNWPAQEMLTLLFTLPQKHGGHLPFNTNEKSGGGPTFKKAVDLLWSLLPPEAIPAERPSFSTIRRIRSDALGKPKKKSKKKFL